MPECHEDPTTPTATLTPRPGAAKAHHDTLEHISQEKETAAATSSPLARAARFAKAFWRAVAAGVITVTVVQCHESASRASNHDPDEVVLDIPPRKQWMNDHGYCGEVSIQQSLLYYGGYASQDKIRRIGRGEILFDWNMENTISKFKLNFTRFKSKKKNQWENYITWTKNNIVNGYPVIGALYWDQESAPEYDHIVTFVGVRSSALGGSAFDGGDMLLFADHFSRRQFERRFDQMVDDRAMKKACKGFPYCIPIKQQYGIAVTGIKDPDEETYPARLSINSWDEPNVSEDDDPKTLKGTLLVTGLTSGEDYAILRYNDPAKIPEQDFLNSDYDARFDFTAAAESYSFNDRFASDSVAIYRVVDVG